MLVYAGAISVAPQPCAPKLQFPWGAAVAERFVFWQNVSIYTRTEGVWCLVCSQPLSLLHISAMCGRVRFLQSLHELCDSASEEKRVKEWI